MELGRRDVESQSDHSLVHVLILDRFCECEARYIKKAPKGEGYIVYFTWHGAKRAAFSSNFYEDLMWVRAKKFVFLGAGTLGTGEILLRSQQMGLGVSKNLCRGMSGNGDILAFGYASFMNHRETSNSRKGTIRTTTSTASAEATPPQSTP